MGAFFKISDGSTDIKISGKMDNFNQNQKSKASPIKITIDKY